MLCRFRASAPRIRRWGCSRSLPCCLPTGRSALVDTNVRALTDSDLAWADVALVSGMLVQKDNLLIILARCRANGIRTVVGGPIASGFGELHRYADHVVIGEAEELIAPLAEDLERGTAKPQYKASEMPPTGPQPIARPEFDQHPTLQFDGHPILTWVSVQLRVLRHH